jgi:hypothetical protein
VKGPPTGHEQQASFVCTESKILPTVDLAFTAIHLIEAATAEGSYLVSEGRARAFGIDETHAKHPFTFPQAV